MQSVGKFEKDARGGREAVTVGMREDGDKERRLQQTVGGVVLTGVLRRKLVGLSNKGNGTSSGEKIALLSFVVIGE